MLVAVLVGAVVAVGANAGPKLTGIFAVFPIVMLSLMLILHPRIGGAATAAIIANTMWGLVGFALVRPGAARRRGAVRRAARTCVRAPGLGRDQVRFSWCDAAAWRSSGLEP